MDLTYLSRSDLGSSRTPNACADLALLFDVLAPLFSTMCIHPLPHDSLFLQNAFEFGSLMLTQKGSLPDPCILLRNFLWGRLLEIPMDTFHRWINNGRAGALGFCCPFDLHNGGMRKRIQLGVGIISDRAITRRNTSQVAYNISTVALIPSWNRCQLTQSQNPKGE